MLAKVNPCATHNTISGESVRNTCSNITALR